MGFVGYYMRREKWWSLLILVPMLGLVGYHYAGFLREAISFFPNHLLSAVFCAATVVIYPLFIFKDKKLRLSGLVVSVVLLIACTVYAFAGGRQVYTTTIMAGGGRQNVEFDDTWSVSLEDESYGKVSIVYEEGIETFTVRADFIRTGETKLILESPDGEKRTFDLVINRDSYRINEVSPDAPENGGTEVIS